MKGNMLKEEKNMTVDQKMEDNKIMRNTIKNNAMTTGSVKKGFAKRAALLGLLSVMTAGSVMPAMAATTAGSGTTVSTESVSDQTLTVTAYTTTTVAQVENINLQINSNTSFYMSWNSVSGAAGYEVWRCASGGEWVMIRDNAKTSHIGGAQLTSGVKYYFRVRAYKTVNGNKVYGAWSSQVSVVYGTPAAPKNMKVSAASSNSNMTLSWTLYGSASKFIIERKASGGSWTVLGTVSGSVKTYTDKTATSGTKYYYRVRAYNTVGSSTLYGAYSDEVSCTAAGTVKVKKVSLNKSSVTIKAGKTKTLKATVTPSNATNSKVTWSSSNTSVAKVSSSGVITAKKKGTAVITAKTANGKKATCKVTVKKAETSGTYLDVSAAYTQLNTFRTKKGVWYWNKGNTTKTYFNKSGCKTLSKLSRNAELEAVAKKRAKELATSFSHTRPDGTSYKTIYPCSTTGENIACGQTSVSMVMTSWKEADESYDDQGHRRNMLSTKFNAVGIACYKVNGQYYWVMALGNM